MDTEQSRVIVTISGNSSALPSITATSPRSAPKAVSPKEAAAHLVNQLTRALDSALIDWRRDRVDQGDRGCEGVR